MTTGKTIAFTRRTFVGKVMSLLFKTLSRLVTTFLPRLRASLVAQTVKRLPAVQETWVRKLPLEKEMATHSSTLAWKIPRTEEPGRL